MDGRKNLFVHPFVFFMLILSDVKSFLSALTDKDKLDLGFVSGDGEKILKEKNSEIFNFENKGFVLIERDKTFFMFHVFLFEKFRNFKNAKRMIDEIIIFSKNQGCKILGTLVPKHLEKLIQYHSFFENTQKFFNGYCLFIGEI